MRVTTSDPTGAQLLAAEAARVAAAAADIQYQHTDGVIDLTWGHPDPSVFAAEAVAGAAEAVLEVHGWQALTYGAPHGAATTRAAIAEHLTRVDTPAAASEVIVTAGSSGGLDLVLSLLAVPGDVVLVEQPTYFLALRMFADHGLRVIGLRSDAIGPIAEAVSMGAAAARSDGRNAFLYLVPTFANPTGRCLTRARAVELLDAANRDGVIVIEDDVYRDTTATSPPSMWSIDRDAVIRLGSFSKSLAPGLRVGYLTAALPMIERIGGCGLLDSGGGVNHFASMLVGELIQSGRFREIAAEGQRRYAERRAALAAALDSSLFAFTQPDGGYFLWLQVPHQLSAAQVVEAGRGEGVLVSNGRAFFVDEPDGGFVRASFSMLDSELLCEGATRLNRSVGALLD